MKFTLLLSTVLLLGCAPSTAPQPTAKAVAPADIAGMYEYPKRGGGQIVLTLEGSGSYTQIIPLPGRSVTNTGTWSLDKSNLQLPGLWGSDVNDPSLQEKNNLAGTGWYVVDSKSSPQRFAIFGGEAGDGRILNRK